MNIESKSVIGFKEREVPYKLFDQQSQKLAVMLPGMGYTNQGPLLHYTTGVFINMSFDVIHINYHYSEQDFADFSEVAEALKIDVQQVFDEILRHKHYDEIYLIGKSLGTLAMSTVLQLEELNNAKAIWLTPLIQRDDVRDAMMQSKHQGLYIMGDKDDCYIEERHRQVISNQMISSILIPNTDHSLEYRNDAIGSINVLKDVLIEIEKFLEVRF